MLDSLILKPSVLIVDDDAGNRDVLKDILEDEGFPVILAANGREALHKVNPEIGIILMDVVMPILDGISVCKAIVSNPETATIPIIFLTAYGDEQIRSAALKAGGFDFLTKPVRASELVIKIKALARMGKAKVNSGRRRAFRELVTQEKLQGKDDDPGDSRWTSKSSSASFEGIAYFPKSP